MVMEKARLQRRTFSIPDVNRGWRDSQRNKNNIGAGSTACTRRILQHCLDQSAAVTIETAISLNDKNHQEASSETWGGISPV